MKRQGSNILVFALFAFMALNIANLGAYSYLALIVLLLVSGQAKFSVGRSFLASVFLVMMTIPGLNTYYLVWSLKTVFVSIAASMLAHTDFGMKDLRKLMVMTAMLLAIQLFASYFYNIAHGNTSGRNYISISTMTESGATLMSTLMTPLLGLLPFFLFSRVKIHPALGVTYIAMLVMSVRSALWLEGRSFFGILLVVFAAGILFAMVKTRERSQRNKMWRRLFLVLLLLGVVAFMFRDRIVEVYTASNFSYRFGRGYEDIAKTRRTELVRFYFEHFRDALYGGGVIRHQIEGLMSHTLWLDVLDMCGLFAFVAIVALTVYSIVVFIRFFRNSTGLDYEIQLLLFGFFISAMTQFCLEPVVEGCQWLFLYFWFIVCYLDNIYNDGEFKLRKNRMG